MKSIARALKIRDARLPDDKPAILRFIVGLQQFEKKMEPDRRTDPSVAEEFYEVLLRRLKERDGRIFIAEEHGTTIGWAQVHEEENEIYVVPDERRFGHIAELYVAESARRRGIGRALMATCEDWARGRGLKVMTIGALAGNGHAYALYQTSGYAPYVTELRKYLR
jgi:GNAT superfamily N-acetyltransferase